MELWDIPHRRIAEQPSVLPAELRHALVADAKCRGAGIDGFDQQQTAGFVEPDLLLVLQRAQPGDGGEVMVKGGYAHGRHVGQRLDAHWLGMVLAQPGDHRCDPV